VPIHAGAQLGPYEVVAPLGVGGMGEVWRARDRRLNRDVALKVLPDVFASDAERLARFQREAQLLASLNHPHIAAIYGVEEGPAEAGFHVRALVLELVEGPTLADRIADGPVPLEEALAIAPQIAEALEAAHDKGIVHRDLKPSNIKLTADGQVKVLDFGLAKLLSSDVAVVGQPGGLSPALMQSPTVTSPAMTMAGVMLGTAAYMSPEQARGKVVDKRADIWAFGAVLYELVTGRKAFEGEDVTDTISKVMQTEPRFDDAPIQVRRLLRKCLEKDPRKRLRDIGDAWELLDDPVPVASAASPSRGPAVVPWSVALLAIALAAAALWAPWRRTEAVSRPVVRLEVELGSDVALPPVEFSRTVAISPDGTRIAYIARVAGGPRRLYTRRLDQQQATELAGTDGAQAPFFSPDNRWIGFVSRKDDLLGKVSVDGGAVIPIVRSVNAFAGAAWDDQDGIVVGRAIQGGVTRYPSGGGAPETLLRAGPSDFVFRYPEPLPQRRGVLFVKPELDAVSIEAVSLPDGRRTMVVQGGAARYVPTGHLLYMSQTTLFAVPFDVKTLQVRGAQAPLINDVASSSGGSGDYDVSNDGTLVYRKGVLSDTSMAKLEMVNASGRQTLTPVADFYAAPKVSPDGTRVAISVFGGPNQGLWVYDIQSGGKTLLSRGGGTNPGVAPVWTSDSRYLVFGVVSGGGLYWMPADGSTPPQRLLDSPAQMNPGSFSTDGTLAYTEVAPFRIFTVAVTRVGSSLKAGAPVAISQGDAPELNPAFSPDGRWLAYSSEAVRPRQLFVRPADPRDSRKWPVSTNGGDSPVWTHSGELLFRQGDAIMAVKYAAHDGEFRSDMPRVWLPKLGGPQFDIAGDDRHVFVLTRVGEDTAKKPEHTFIYVQNFFDELKRRVPANP
jgi:serine/threonine-protein kinase